MHILSVSEMRALESTADMAGHSYAQMMERAGQGVAMTILRRVPVKGRNLLILVGPGNNGGDGLVAARLLHEAGSNVTAYLTSKRDPEQDPVFKQAQERGVACVHVEDDPQGEALRRLVSQAHVLVDALLGTGATPPLRGTVASVLRRVNAALATLHKDPLTPIIPAPARNTTPRPFIVAVDGPSGMDFDTGGIDPLALSAHLTVTFASPKWGHLRFPGASCVGKLVIADIGIPEGLDIPGDGVELATPPDIQAWLPQRPLDAHKGTFGKALIVAGSVNYTGAAALAASAAVRAGAGLVTLAIPGPLHPAVASVVPEATYHLLPHTLGVLDRHAAPVVREQMTQYTAMLIGPGLGQTTETTAFMRRLLGLEGQPRRTGFISTPETEEEEGDYPPLVVDADGLNLLSKLDDWPALLPPGSILTPHPGEMARLTGLSAEEVQSQRLDVARQRAKAWGHVVVLKGAFTIIAAPEGRCMLLPFANPGLSSAGTGDVLAGTIAALRAQGLAPFEAAVSGAYLHGLAGEVAREKLGTAGIAASDVAQALPEAWQRLAASQ